ncbi:helix-turn-helix domain-containing protein [Halorarum salinum]|uniref:ArsR family transcriptional regulator n=1 Tax=Halorarum salinum TaxID=2743089 RepID=A0A7D5QFD5_9EURY|nr:ArsR family transcriptional regulator [Halobaculum salinum]QLG61343.1 ArsR family transcriptional regulator [Halobaculum salinum]
MRLTSPTDFEILEALSDGKRNNAANLSYVLDKNRSYINTRLPVLADYGLVERVGPAPNSGLYEITERGLAAHELRDRYGEDNFEDLLAEQVAD